MKNVFLTVFCDSQKALKEIKRSPSWKKNPFLRCMIHCIAKKPCKNSSFIFWLLALGHISLIKNKKADLAAKLKAEK